MEWIKEAVDMARSSRNGAVPFHALGKNKWPQTMAAGKVQYTQTRVVKLNDDLLEKNRIIFGNQDSSATSAYRMLRTQVLQKMRENDWRSLAVTSVGAGEGKTVTAINLALSLARGVNQTILLVDFDLRRPSVHRMLGYEPEKNLSHFLFGNTPLPEILFNPGIERLVILPCGEPIENSSEMLSSPQMVALVEELKTRYPERILIFDLPPLLATDDPLAFSPYVDAFLLVVEEGKTIQDDLVRAVGLLGDSPILGAVLNKTEETTNNY